MDWLEILDFEMAAANCHSDMLGDWYRDPWGWPEVNWCVKKRPDLLVARLNARGVRHSAKLDVAKENFGIRPAIVMDPLDRVIYQALVDRLSIRLAKGMRGWVYGWRLSRKNPRRGHYNSNSIEWTNFLSSLTGLADWNLSVLKTDIVSFFASVNLDRLAEQINARAGGSRPVERLLDLLHGWASVPGRSGLPQRSAASAFLANVYLSPLDDVLDYFGGVQSQRGPLRWGNDTTVLNVIRWMDDVWLFGNDAGDLRHAQIEIQESLRGLGLHINLAKTDVLEGSDVDEQAKQVEHSAVDGALDGMEGEERLRPLNDLVDRLLAQPEVASRTSVRFVASRMKDHEVFDRVDDFAERADRMPHVADHLARLFRKSDRWGDLADWYAEYRQSPWASVDWSVAQLGTMFPSGSENAISNVRDLFAEELSTMPSLPVAAVAAQRLASWAPDVARVAIREAAKRADHPLQRRTLALAALAAKDERAFVRSLLSEFEENQPTLLMLSDRSFRPLRVAPDFAS